MRRFIRWAVLCALLAALALLPMTFAQNRNETPDKAPDDKEAKPADNKGDGQHGNGQHGDGQHGNTVDGKAPAGPATRQAASSTPAVDPKRAELEKQIEQLHKRLEALEKQQKQ